MKFLRLKPKDVCGLCALLFLVLAVPICGASEERPPFNASRYKEDYGFLKDPARRTEPFDRLKYIPVNEAGDWYLTLGGEIRQHFEFIDNNNWGRGPQDRNGYYLQRYLGHADLHMGRRLRLFGTLMSGIESGRNGGPRAVDEDRLDLHQAFAEGTLWENAGTSLALRAGRQEIIFGSRRFLNYRERPNLRLSHDALTMMFKSDGWDLRAFGARPVAIQRGFFDDASSNSRTLWGVYGVRKAAPGEFRLNVDLYYIGFHDRNARYDQGRGEELRHAIGSRWWGRRHELEYNFEFLYQFGTFGAGNIHAYALASDTAYTLHLGGPRRVRFSLRADVYSGDKNPADGELNSFNPYFPKGKHISQLAASGLINQRDLHPRINATLTRHWSFTTSALFIWRDSLNDGIYSIANALLRTGSRSRARYVGVQPELEVKYTFNRYVDLKGIFVYFVAGEFLKQTPPGRDITYLGSMLTFRF